MLKISDLAFSYSGNGCKVFNDFSLSFEKGAVYGLLGLNGTGKYSERSYFVRRPSSAMRR